MTAMALLAQPFSAYAASAQETLRLGTHRKLAPLNPFEVSDTFSTPLLELVFSHLIRLDEKGDFQPDLAESWKVSEDGLTYFITLRKGVRFHDGKECAAEDVRYSFELAARPEINSVNAEHLSMIREIKARSQHEIEITLKEPFSPFLLSLWRVYIVPRHLLVDMPGDLPGFLKKPVGTGPFKFSSQDDSGVKLRANPVYFDGPSQLDEVDVRVYEDKDQVWSAFVRDEQDLHFYIRPENSAEIKDHPEYRVFSSLSLAGYALMLNMRRPPLDDARVREAVSLAVNREELIEILEKGQGVMMNGPFYPESWANDKSVGVPLYDPRKARELLLEAGYKETKNGMEKNGKSLMFNLLMDSKNEHLVRMGKLIRQQLQESGIGVSFHYFGSYEEFRRRVYDKSEIDIYLVNVNTGPEPDSISQYWYSGQSFNIGGYSRGEVDRLFEAARKAPQKEARARAYHQIHRLIAADKPAVFLYHPYAQHAAPSYVENVEKLVGPFILFNRLKDVRKQGVPTERG